MKKLYTSLAVAALLVSACDNKQESQTNNLEPAAGNIEQNTPISEAAVVETYSEIVLKSYQDALAGAQDLQKAVDNFLAAPSEESLNAAKQAWLSARTPYSQTEAYRFYDGPIDFVNEKAGEEGPEGQLNAWPLNEAYIDYVEGNPQASIINSGDVEITKETIADKNQEKDEADVATGYHAIEFLLWGQDLSKETAGNRPYTDFVPGEADNDRRREYLKVATDLLVDNLEFLVSEWEEGKDNYAAQFKSDSKEALGNIMTGMATLAGFELSSERMATSLDSGDQEDEHSCFSDNTHNDFIDNAQSIANIYFGKYGNYNQKSIYDLLKAKDEKLALQLREQINKTAELMKAIPQPIDREVLSTPEGSKGRQLMEEAVASLQQEAKLIVEAGKVLGVDAKLLDE